MREIFIYVVSDKIKLMSTLLSKNCYWLEDFAWLSIKNGKEYRIKLCQSVNGKNEILEEGKIINSQIIDYILNMRISKEEWNDFEAYYNELCL